MTGPARAVVEQVLDASLAADLDAVLGLLARDGCIEWPYRPAGVPGRLAGHEEIRAYLAKAAAAPMRWDQFTDLTVYETTDPEVVIVEYTAVGRLTDSGEPIRQPIIAVFRVRAGLIVSWRDYLNPLTLIEAGVIPPSATSATTNRQPRATPSADRRMIS